MFETFDGIASSLIAAAGLVFVAFLTFIFNRRMQLEAAWRSEKLQIYKEFGEALGGNLEGESSDETHKRFSRASNNLILIASNEVLDAHNRYREHISVRNPNRDYEKDGPLLAELFTAMRRDLDLKGSALRPEAARLWNSARRVRKQ